MYLFRLEELLGMRRQLISIPLEGLLSRERDGICKPIKKRVTSYPTLEKSLPPKTTPLQLCMYICVWLFMCCSAAAPRKLVYKHDWLCEMFGSVHVSLLALCLRDQDVEECSGRDVPSGTTQSQINEQDVSDYFLSTKSFVLFPTFTRCWPVRDSCCCMEVISRW